MKMVTPGRRWIITDSVLCDRWKNSMQMTGSFGLLSPNSTWHDTMTGTSPGKKCGVDTASVQREPPANSRGRGPYSGSWKPFSFWMPNGSSKFASFPYFANLRVKLQTLPIPAPLKLTGFASVSGTTFWQKWGGRVQLSIRVHAVVTPVHDTTRHDIWHARSTGASAALTRWRHWRQQQQTAVHANVFI